MSLYVFSCFLKYSKKIKHFWKFLKIPKRSFHQIFKNFFFVKMYLMIDDRSGLVWRLLPGRIHVRINGRIQKFWNIPTMCHYYWFHRIWLHILKADAFFAYFKCRRNRAVLRPTVDWLLFELIVVHTFVVITEWWEQEQRSRTVVCVVTGPFVSPVVFISIFTDLGWTFV